MYQPHHTVNIHEAKTHFSQLVDAASKGKEIVIAKAGTPVARLVPIEDKKPMVRFGLFKDKVKLSDDFDSPLSDDTIALFEGN
jgi:prevent-host-death family protein